MNKYKIDYFYCEHCGFLQTESPYWLKETYKLPMALSDIGILSRNINLSKITSIIIYFLFNRKEDF